MDEITPLPAATVTLVRDSDDGLEVLMLQRNLRSGFMPGMFLFPGGALDESDSSREAYACCAGLDEAAANRILGVAGGGLAYWVAAVRESFEEAGILLARDARGAMLALDEAARIERFRAYRRDLNRGACDFAAVIAAENLRIAAGDLVYFSHWITPHGAPRRYDTRFFVARAPEAQDALHDDLETIAFRWIHPAAALAAHARGEFNMRTPTLKTLELFAQYPDADSLIVAMRELKEIPAILPRIAEDGRRLLPGEPGYEEAAAAASPGKWQT